MSISVTETDQPNQALKVKSGTPEDAAGVASTAGIMSFIGSRVVQREASAIETNSSLANSETHRTFLDISYFAGLDGLRCFSILAVIGYHAKLTTTLFQRGDLGVDLFFVISGFLITTLLLREQASTGRVSLRAFYLRRGLRIFPAYYVVIALYVGVVAALERGPEGHAFFQNLPAFLTYTSNWFVASDQFAPEGRVIFYFAWSLATEEQFYLFWPSLIILFGRRWFLSLAAISGLMVADLALQFLIKSGALDFGLNGNRAATSIETPICLGCILAYVLHRPRSFAWAYRWLGQAWALPALLLVLLAGCVSTATPSLVCYVVMTLVVGACCIRPDPEANWLLCNAPMRYLGTISYGMYLLHMLSLNAAKRLPVGDGWLFLLTGLAITILVATVSFHVLETPFLRLKDRIGRSPAHARKDTTVPLAAEGREELERLGQEPSHKTPPDTPQNA